MQVVDHNGQCLKAEEEVRGVAISHHYICTQRIIADQMRRAPIFVVFLMPPLAVAQVSCLRENTLLPCRQAHPMGRAARYINLLRSATGKSVRSVGVTMRVTSLFRLPVCCRAMSSPE